MANNITTVAGIVEPLRAYNYIVTIVRSPVAISSINGLELRAMTASLPEQSFETIKIPYRWFDWYVQGRERTEKTFEIKYWEGIDLGIYKALWNWRVLVGDWMSGTQQSKQTVSGTLQVSVLDGSENVLANMILENAFLTDLKQVDLGYDDSKVVEVEATFQFDYMQFA